MFPFGICVATLAMLTGIGGAALFIPVFVIVFPLLGPEYPVATSAAIGAALLIQVFGFASGFAGYQRKRLIDYRSAAPFIGVSAPVAFAGALLFGVLQDHEALLKAGYALMMLGLCPIILRRRPALPATPYVPPGTARETRQITARDGRTYRFERPRQGPVGALYTALGSLLTGFFGVGVGEVVLPQMVKRNGVPVAVAAATTVYVVIVTVAIASLTQIATLVSAGGTAAVPWNLVCYAIPGVIVGGQIGPWLQGRFAQRTMEHVIAFLFALIGVAMAWSIIRDVG